MRYSTLDMPQCFPQRWVVCAFCSLALAIIEYKNACYNSIKDMIKHFNATKTEPSYECPFLCSSDTREDHGLKFTLPDFYWDPTIRRVADSSFFLGRISSTVPAGMLADIGYSKYVVSVGIFLVMVRFLLLPPFKEMRSLPFLLLNFAEGVGDGFMFSSIFAMLAWYTPSSKRNYFIAIAVSGLYYGKALGSLFYKLFYDGFKSFSFGHLTTGSIALVWLVSWLVYTYHTPVRNPFLQENRTVTRINRKRSLRREIKKLQNIPWRNIVSSRPLLSLVLAYCSLNFTSYFITSRNLDSFQEYILHLPNEFARLSTIGVLAILPSMLLGGWFADWIVKHNIMSKTNVKKLFAFFGVFCCSILQASVVTVAGCNIELFWVLAITSIYIGGPAVPVLYSTLIDLEPQYAGLLMGIMTTAMTICKLVYVVMEELLEHKHFSMTQWSIQFIVVSLLAFFCIVPFLFFGSSERQRWGRRRRPPRVDPHHDQPPAGLQTHEVTTS